MINEADVNDIIDRRCSAYYAGATFWDCIIAAPDGVSLKTSHDIARSIHAIYLQSAVSYAM